MATGIPKVTINVNSDNLGQSAQTADGVAALVLTGGSVTGKIQTGTPIKVTSLAAAETNGIAKTGINAYAYKHVKEFYDEAGEGAELWLMVVPDTVTMADMADKTEAYAKKVLDDAKGSVRLLGISRESAAGVVIANGVDEDVDNAVVNAQALIAEFASKFKSASVIIDGKDYNGTEADLKDYTTATHPFVSVALANADGSNNAAIGLLLGRLAKDPVQRNPARVKTGALPITAAHLTDGTAVEDVENDWDAIHNKGYIFLRTYVGRAGYFFTDAPTANLAANDLNNIPRVRVIYKARRIAYSTFVNEILDEIPLEADGKIAPVFLKNWQALIDAAITTQMTAKGEISGSQTIIDPSQDVLGSNEIKVTLNILPVGYAKYITVELGFVTTLTN